MKTINKIIALSFSTLLVTVVLFSCRKMEVDKIATSAWNPNLAVPVAYAQFDVYDILASDVPEELVVIDENTGMLSLIYSGQLLSFGATDIVQLTEVQESTSIETNELNLSPSVGFNGSQNASVDDKFEVAASGGAEMTSVHYKEGVLQVTATTNLRHSIDVVVTFPGLTKGGVPQSASFTMNYIGSIPHSGSSSIDLTNAIADLTSGNTTFNTIDFTVAATVTGSGEEISGTESLDLNFAMNNLAFINALGYFGQQEVLLDNDSINIRLFKNAIDGFVQFTNPRVTFEMRNSFGFPIRLTFDDLKTINVNTGNEVLLTGYPESIDILQPSSMGESNSTFYELNEGNVNGLNTMVNSTPQYFYFEMHAESNPDGQTATPNFVTEDSRLDIFVDLDLQLEGYAYGFEVRDTFDFSLGENIDMLEYVMFRLNIDNGFPVDVNIGLTFLDVNKQLLFNTFDGEMRRIIESGIYNSDGRVITPVRSTTDITLEDEELDLITRAEYVIVRGTLETNNGTQEQVVKFFEDYKFNVKLSMQVQGKVNF
jgi:hypothetical protein